MTTEEEAISRICAAVEAGDYETAASYVGDNIVFHGTVGGIDEGQVLHGAAALVRYFNDVIATWDEWHVQTEEVRRNGDTFVVFWRETTRSHGIEMHNETATVYRFRDGEIVEVGGYLDRAAALEAAGLE